MNREEMLKELKSIDLRAIPTVVTMDMGLEYDYATAEGAGTGFGGMGDWPAHMFQAVEKERWFSIREAIRNNVLMKADLEGTGLDGFLENVKTINEEVVPSEVLQGLLTLPEIVTDPYYCFFDGGLWYDQYADRPLFFTTEKELKDEFFSHYVDDLTKWEDMDDDELSGWYDRLHGEMDEFTVYTYDPEE